MNFTKQTAIFLLLALFSFYTISCSSGSSDSDAGAATDSTVQLGTVASAVVTELSTNMQVSAGSTGISPRVMLQLQSPILAVSGVSETGLSESQRTSIINTIKNKLKSQNLNTSADVTAILPVVMQSYLEALGNTSLTASQKTKLLQVAAYSMSTSIKKVRDAGISISSANLTLALRKAIKAASENINDAGISATDYAAAVKELNTYVTAGFKNAGFSAIEINAAVRSISRGMVAGLASLENVDSTRFAAICEKVAQGTAAGLANLSSVNNIDKTAVIRNMAYGMAVGFALVPTTVKGSTFDTTNLKSWIDSGAAAGDNTLTVPDVTDELSAGSTDGTNEVNNTSTYSVIYSKNGAASGTVPAATSGTGGDTVTVTGNTGSLGKTGHAFNGWNTAPDGSGTTYTSGNTLTISDSSVILYALWKPNTPTGVTIAKGIGSLQVSWSAVTGATAYNVHYNTVEETTSATASSDINSTSYTISGLTSGTTYYIWVTAKTGATSSDFGSPVAESPAIAGAIYVAMTGNDTTGDGSQGNPFLTIQKGIDTANANGNLEVHVQEGTYSISTAAITLKENVSLLGGYSSTDWSRDTLNNVSKISHPSNTITTLVQGSNLTSHIKIDGMSLWFSDSNAAVFTGITLSSSPYVDITNNKIEIGAGNSTGKGISVSGVYQGKISNNYLDMTLQAPRYNYGLYLNLSDNSDVTVVNNVIDNGVDPVNGAPYNIYLDGGGSNTKAYIRNNTFISGKYTAGGAAAIGLISATYTLFVDNNIAYCYDPPTYANDYFIYGTTSTMILSSAKNNVLFNFDKINLGVGTQSDNIAALETNYASASGNLNTDLSTYFVNTANGDWHLQASTPATVTAGGLDGSALGWGFSDDRDKNNRTGNGTTGWSIGAYEKD